MTDRLASDWTETAEQAFGTNKGRREEIMVRDHIKHVFGNVVDYESDKDAQIAGIDLSYKNGFGDEVTLQVKGNYDIILPVCNGAPSARTFIVERSISKVQAQFMVHVNADHKQYLVYYTNEMIKYVSEHEDDLKWFMSGGKRCTEFKDDALPWFHKGELIC